MAVVIRLQGLRITAGSEDIRSFFTGLKIPDGGVHIIGGAQEEAFIIFASDEDARRAMSRSGGVIKGSPVNLLLSSRNEMQKVLEASTKKPEPSNSRRPYKGNGRQANPEPASYGGQPPMDRQRVEEPPQPEAGNRQYAAGRQGQPRPAKSEGNETMYLSLFGMPFSTTKEEVMLFFDGLRVEDIILLKNDRGQPRGAGLVKFATVQDATEGLKRDREYIGNRYVQVSPTNEQKWLDNGGSLEPADPQAGFGSKPSPAYSRNPAPYRSKSRSPIRSPSYQSKSSSPSSEDLCVMVDNLSFSVEKRDLRAFFQPVPLKDDQIIYVTDKYGSRTRRVFVLFTSIRDYCAALSHHQEELHHRPVSLVPVSKEKMVATLQTMNQQPEEHDRPSHSATHRSPPRERPKSDKVCLYVRNLPFDVRKVEIMDFFHGFGISEDSVILLRDERGNGLGEALLTFPTETEAMMAQSLNGQRFLGSEVMLKCISRAQMQDFGVLDQSSHGQRDMAPGGTGEVRYSARAEHQSSVPVERPWREDPLQPDPYPRHQDVSGNFFGRQGDGYEQPLNPPDNFSGREDVAPDPRYGPSQSDFHNPTLLRLSNLPAQIHIDEIYDFCYGYSVIPGTASLQFDRRSGSCSATVVFESRREAIIAVKELHGRPIGKRKISVEFE